MLFPHLRGLRVGQVEDTGDAVVIRACCRARAGAVPGVRGGVLAGPWRVRAGSWPMARPAAGRC